MEENAAEALMLEFAIEAQERLGRLEEYLLLLPEAPPERFAELMEQILRDLHTLKGNSALVGLGELQVLAHQMEDLATVLAPGQVALAPLLAGVDRFRAALRSGEASAPPAEGALAAVAAGPAPGEADTASARISFATIDSLIDQLAEMVMYRNRLADGLDRLRLATAGASAEVPDRVPSGQPSSAGAATAAAWEQVEEAHQRLGTILDGLQEGILQLRMVPLRSLLGPLHRLVHDECEMQGKSVQLLAAGGDTPLDKGLVELAGEVLGHLVRNAVIHGIERPEERRRAGKPPRGTLRLSAAATSREVRIDVADDGRGLRRSAITAAALRLGVAGAAAADPAQLVFLTGLSTREHADLSAGRGVGLGAVRGAVERRGGRIEVASTEGAGCLFRLTLPLSASITRALLLRCDAELYALPLRAVIEGLRFLPGQVHEVNGAGVLRWRGRVLPALDLGCSFGTAAARRASGCAVVIEEGRRRRALLVDDIQGVREIVVKPLDPIVGRGDGFAGSTVLGDGRAVLILDAPGLLDLPPWSGAPA